MSSGDSLSRGSRGAGGRGSAGAASSETAVRLSPAGSPMTGLVRSSGRVTAGAEANTGDDGAGLTGAATVRVTLAVVPGTTATDASAWAGWAMSPNASRPNTTRSARPAAAAAI